MTEQKKETNLTAKEKIDFLTKEFFNDKKLTYNFRGEENKKLKSELIFLIEKVVKIEKELSEKNSAILESIIEDRDVDATSFSNIILIDFNSKIKNYFKNKLQNDHELLNLFNDKKIVFFLHKGIVTNIYTELFLIQTRKELLKKYANNAVVDSNFNKVALPIIISLAHQCFNNEYIWNISEDEKKDIKKIISRIKKNIENNIKIPNGLIGLLCCYKNISEYQFLLNYLRDKKPDIILNLLVQRQLIEIKEEEEIAKDIKSLTKIDDNISIKVMGQYESNPYPRWLNLTEGSSYKNYLEYIKKTLPEKNLFSEEFEIKNVLIAGCGTGKHPLEVAKIDPTLKITAIDISKPSIAYGIRKSREFGIKNITWAQADILKLNEIDKKFDLVESSGVIHHLKDPNKGFLMLNKKLRKGGLMKLGLYARNFRSSYLKDIKKYKNENHFKNDINGIRKLRLFLINNIENNKYQKLFKIPDIYNTSGFRDLIMHVQEHDFSIKELNKMISDKYNFLGFFWNRNNSIKANEYFVKIHQEKSKLDIMNWEPVEEKNPEIFSGMYQFWLQKK